MPLANVKKRELKLVLRLPNESTLKDAYADQLTIFKGAKEASSSIEAIKQCQ